MKPALPTAPPTLLFALLTLLSGCAAPGTDSCPDAGFARQVRAELELPVAEAPFDDVHANWKERLDQEYVFLELRGTYTHTARALKDVLEAAQRAGLEPVGAPFALFYDDPGHTPVNELRSRACVPVAEAAGSIASPYGLDVLPGGTVVYAFVGGPYGEVPRAYPGLFAYAGRMGWKECGPIREVYLIPPGSVTSWSDLVCEVQLPAQPGR